MNIPVENQVAELLSESAGRNADHKAQIIMLTREGLPMRSALEVARRYELSERQLAELLGISTRTLARLKSSDSRLNPVQSDRLFRLSRIVNHAEGVFDTLEIALDWLKSSNRALGGSVPLTLLDTDAGTVQVEELLTRIEYGVYS